MKLLWLVNVNELYHSEDEKDDPEVEEEEEADAAASKGKDKDKAKKSGGIFSFLRNIVGGKVLDAEDLKPVLEQFRVRYDEQVCDKIV